MANGEMDLIHDPVYECETGGDALTVGKACDEQRYLWYARPSRDGGTSMHAHRKLTEQLETPPLGSWSADRNSPPTR